MDDLEARKTELEAKSAAQPAQEPIALHLALAEAYRNKIASLADSLNDEANKAEAAELLRGLVSEVRSHPDTSSPDGHVIELNGELSAILAFSAPKTPTTPRIAGCNVLMMF